MYYNKNNRPQPQNYPREICSFRIVCVSVSLPVRALRPPSRPKKLARHHAPARRGDLSSIAIKRPTSSTTCSLLGATCSRPQPHFSVVFFPKHNDVQVQRRVRRLARRHLRSHFWRAAEAHLHCGEPRHRAVRGHRLRHFYSSPTTRHQRGEARRRPRCRCSVPSSCAHQPAVWTATAPQRPPPHRRGSPRHLVPGRGSRGGCGSRRRRKRSNTHAPTPTAVSCAAPSPRAAATFSPRAAGSQAELLAPLHGAHCTEYFVSMSLAPSGSELRRFSAVAGTSTGNIW
jgi:hypothetical protein